MVGSSSIDTCPRTRLERFPNFEAGEGAIALVPRRTLIRLLSNASKDGGGSLKSGANCRQSLSSNRCPKREIYAGPDTPPST
jgi:hypothetical protein